MANKDYYELLGVSKNATDEEIKSAYKKMVMKYHPDRYATKPEAEKKQAEDKFKEINHAYDVLGDKQKRANYDQFGSEDGMGAGFGGGGAGGFSNFGGGFEDILNEMFFGGGKRNRANMPVDGDDITIRLDLTFEEAIFGCEKTVKVYRTEKCSDCKGTGAADPSSVKTCPMCSGSGMVNMTQNTIFGRQTVRTTCTNCGGSGKIIGDKCKTCRGSGQVKRERSIPVTVPAGADNNQTITYYNEGESGRNGGSNGKLVIVLSVKPHPLFKRKGNDLYIDLPITIAEATLGGKVTVPTTKSPISYSIAAGTQSGTMFRLKGYGVKYLKKEQYGDLYVTVNVEIPTKLSKKQEKLLQEFEDSIEPKQYDEKRNFNKKWLNK